MPQVSHEVTQKVAAAVRHRIANPLPRHARIRGIHAEGPIIHTRGGLPASAVGLSLTDFDQLLQDLSPIKIMTISPSEEKLVGFGRMRRLLERGIRVAIGHDAAATEENILACLRLGQQYGQQLHCTHIFNASAFHHRNVGLVNFALLDKFPRLIGYEGLQPPTAEVIGDYVHVHALAVSLAVKSKGATQLAVITDAIIAPDSSSPVHYCGSCIEVQELAAAATFPPPPRRAAVIQSSGTIAGSCTHQLQMFRDLVLVLDISMEDAATMLSETPARIAGCLDQVGTLQPGKQADILAFDEYLNLTAVVVGGEFVPDFQAR